METVNNEGYIVTKSIDTNGAITELKISMPVDNNGELYSPARAGLQQISDTHISSGIHDGAIITQGSTVFQTAMKGSVFPMGMANVLVDLPIYELKTTNPKLVQVTPESRCKTSTSAFVNWDFHDRHTAIKNFEALLHEIGIDLIPPIQYGYDIQQWKTRIQWGIVKENEEGRVLQATCLDGRDACIPSRIKQIVKIPFTDQFYRIDYTKVISYAKQVNAAFEVIPNADPEHSQAEISLIDGFDYVNNTPLVNMYPLNTEMIDATVRYPGSLESGCLVTSGTYLQEYIDSLTIINLGNTSVLVEKGVIKIDTIEYYDGIYDDYFYSTAMDDCLISFEIISGFYFQCSRLRISQFKEFIWSDWSHCKQLSGPKPGCKIEPHTASEIDYRNDEFTQDIYAYTPIKKSEIQDFPGAYSEFAGAIGEFSYNHEGGAKKLNRPDMYKQGGEPDYIDEYDHVERDDLIWDNPRNERPKLVFQRPFKSKRLEKPGRDYVVTDIYKIYDQVIDAFLQPLVHKRFRNVHAIGDEHWMRPLQIIQESDLDQIKADLGISITCLTDGNEAYSAAIEAGATEIEAEKARQLIIRECFYGEKAASHRADGPIHEIRPLVHDHEYRHMPNAKFNNIMWRFDTFAKDYNMTVNQFEHIWNKLYAVAEPWLESTHKDIDCDDLMRYGELAMEAIDAETKSIGQNFKRFLAETLVRVKFNLGVPAYPRFIKFSQERVFYTDGIPSTPATYTQPKGTELKCTFDPVTPSGQYLVVNDIGYDYDANNAAKIPVVGVKGTYVTTLPAGMSRPSIKIKGITHEYNIQIFDKGGRHYYGTIKNWDISNVNVNHPDAFASVSAYMPGFLNTDTDIKSHYHDGSTIDGEKFTYINDMGYKVSHDILPYEEFVFIDKVLTKDLVIIITGPDTPNGIEFTAEWTKLFCNWVNENDNSIIVAPAPTDLIGEVELPYDKVWHKDGWVLLPHMSKYSMPANTPARDIRGTKYEKYVDEIYEKCFHQNAIIANPEVQIVDRMESTSWTPVNGDKHLYSDVIPGKVHQVHVLNYCNRIVYEHERQGFIEDENRFGGSRCHYNDTLSRKSGEIIWTNTWYDTFDLSNNSDCESYCVNAADALYNDAIYNGIGFGDAYSMKTEYLSKCIAGFDVAGADCYYDCWSTVDAEEESNIANGMDPYDASMIKAIKIAGCYEGCMGGCCFSLCIVDALGELTETTIINGGSEWEGILAYSDKLLNCTHCSGGCISDCKDAALSQLAARIADGDDPDIATVEVASEFQDCSKECNPNSDEIPPECQDNMPPNNSLIDCILDLYRQAALDQKKYGSPESPEYDPEWTPTPIDVSVCNNGGGGGSGGIFKCVTACQSSFSYKVKASIEAGYTLSEAMALHAYSLRDCITKCGGSPTCAASCTQTQKQAILDATAAGKTTDEAINIGAVAFHSCLVDCTMGECLAQCAASAKIIGLQAIADGKSKAEANTLMQNALNECSTTECNGNECIESCTAPWTGEWVSVIKEGGDPDETWQWYIEKVINCIPNCTGNADLGKVKVKLKLYHMSQIGFTEPRVVNVEELVRTNFVIPEPAPAYIVRILPELMKKPVHPYHILPRMIWYEILKISLHGGWPREIHAKTIPSRATSHYKFFMPEKVQFEENRKRFFTKSSKYQRTLQIKEGASLLNKSSEGVLNDYLKYLDAENWIVGVSSMTDFEKVYDILFLSNLSVIGYWNRKEIFDKEYKRFEDSLLTFMNVSRLNYILVKPDMNKYTENEIREMYLELTTRVGLFFGNSIKLGIQFDVSFNKDIIKEIYEQPAVNKIIIDCSSDAEVAEIWDKHGDMPYTMDIVLYVHLTKVKDYRIQLMFDRWRESFNFNEVFLRDANTFAMSQEWTKKKNGVGI